ncbi:MAG: septum site-determining protein MinC [Ktedonobacteraceae bacterium]
MFTHVCVLAKIWDFMAIEDNLAHDMAETSLSSVPQTPSGRLEREEQQSVQGNIAIKGTRNGLLLTLEPETPFSDLLGALADRLAEAPAFFRGASLSVDTSRRRLLVSERRQLEDLLSYYYMSVAPIEQGKTKTTRKEAPRTITLQIEETPPVEPREAPVTKEIQDARDPRESNDTLFLRRTVRSGQAIQHHSSIVVMGDVNPGAEIVAGGDIIVWGALRGMVHAGYPDNANALVCSLLLSPVQLRIAHLLSRPPEGFEAQPRPEIASIKNGQIVVESWTNGRMPRK